MDVTPGMINEAFRDGRAATTVLLSSHWLRTSPDEIFTILNCAEMLYLTGQYEEATRVYEDALSRFEDHQWAIFNQMGRMYQRWGRLADAELWFRKAIEIEPGEWPSYDLLGECQALQGKLKDAEATHRAWLKREQEDWFGHYNLGLVLRDQRRLAEAAECLRKSIEIRPENAALARALADVEQAMALAEGGLRT